MTRLIFWRLLQLPLLLWVIYTVTFVLAWLAPGDPLLREGRKPPPEVQAAMRAAYDLDNPAAFYVQYLIGKPRHGGGRTGGVVRGNFGPSLFYKDEVVSQILADGLPVSAELGLAAMIAALLIGVPVGVMGAVRRGSAAGAGGLAMTLIGISLP